MFGQDGYSQVSGVSDGLSIEVLLGPRDVYLKTCLKIAEDRLAYLSGPGRVEFAADVMALYWEERVALLRRIISQG